MELRQPPSHHNSAFFEGTDGIEVHLWNDDIDAWRAAQIVTSFYLSTWGDLIHADSHMAHVQQVLLHQDNFAEENPWQIAQRAMEGKVLPNTLESVSLTFGISNISRACTHQLVRSRVGAVFGQQGGRDNNWVNFDLRVPPSVSEKHREVMRASAMSARTNYLNMLRSGVPYQDARYALPMGLCTNLVASYNLLSFKSLAARRLCNRMHWETNHVVREMTDHVVRALPWVGRSLRSSCEKTARCASVSPMFPPSCYSAAGGLGRSVTAADNPTLSETIAATGGYDWPIESNAVETLYGEKDRYRLQVESQEPDVVLSLVDPSVELIRKEDGEWHLA